MQRGKFNIVIGAQAGSEAKGKLSGWLCAKHRPDLLVMTSSPNAGHTIITPRTLSAMAGKKWDEGVKKVSYHLPIGAVMCDARIALTPASLINPTTFEREIADLGIDPGRITIDPRASVIQSCHIRAEEDGRMSDIGSTLQGIGECRRGKMERKGRGHHTLVGDVADVFRGMGVSVAPTTYLINNSLDMEAMVLCEGTQGFDLDLEHGIDPVYCTSKMINPAMMMAEAGVAPSRVGEVYGVLRPYPIRVNNRTGTSGPYADAEEITWDMVTRWCGAPELLDEITTTTKLPRRVFEFSWQRFSAFVRTCGPTQLCLQFANYIDWSVYEATQPEELSPDVLLFIDQLNTNSPWGCGVRFIGTGPAHQHMVEI